MDTVEFKYVRVIVKTETAWFCVIRGKEVWVPTDQILNRDEWDAGQRGPGRLPEYDSASTA